MVETIPTVRLIFCCRHSEITKAIIKALAKKAKGHQADELADCLNVLHIVVPPADSKASVLLCWYIVFNGTTICVTLSMVF